MGRSIFAKPRMPARPTSARLHGLETREERASPLFPVAANCQGNRAPGDRGAVRSTAPHLRPAGTSSPVERRNGLLVRSGAVSLSAKAERDRRVSCEGEVAVQRRAALARAPHLRSAGTVPSTQRRSYPTPHSAPSPARAIVSRSFRWCTASAPSHSPFHAVSIAPSASSDAPIPAKSLRLRCRTIA